jgi:hypothetical protein
MWLSTIITLQKGLSEAESVLTAVRAGKARFTAGLPPTVPHLQSQALKFQLEPILVIRVFLQLMKMIFVVLLVLLGGSFGVKLVVIISILLIRV